MWKEEGSINYRIHIEISVTTTYGLNSYSYTAAKLWKALPDKLRTLSSLHDFILTIRRYR